MSKYIIDTGDYSFTTDGVLVVGSDCDNKPATFYNSLDNLEELNSDYINEHFGELQDEAYRKGFEDGKKCLANGCVGCEYEGDESRVNPCCECARVCDDHYIPKHSDRIEVGDEVKWNSDVIVITRVYEDGGFNWCDGISQDGRAFHVLAENVRKTGKHYDIQSILEAMRA